MRKFTATCMILSLILLSGCGVHLNFSGTSPFRNLRNGEINQAVESAVDGFVADGNLEDISVGVLSGKQAQFVNRGQMGEHTKVKLGTMTQMFTGMLIPFMTNDNIINKPSDIDQIADDWFHSTSAVPVWPAEEEAAPAEGEDAEGEGPAGTPIEIWQLALHMSGLGAMDTFGKDYATGGMLHNQIENATLDFEPGTAMQDSTLGYALLCETLRMNYNMNAKYVNLVGNQVTGPMDMQNSGFWKADALAGYDGYESTTYDLLKVAAHVNGVLDQTPNLRMQLDGALEEVHDTGKTLAFDMAELNGNTVYFRTGSGEGTTSCIAIIPALDIAVSINAGGNADLMALANQLLDILQ